MPWKASDAPAHNKKTKGKPKLQEAWAKAANAALEEYGDEGKAIATANATVDEMSKDDDRAAPFETLDLMRRDGTMTLGAPSSFDPKSREADVVISTGARVRRRDWMEGEYDEVLDMSPRAVRMSRLNAGAAILDSHGWYRGLEAMLGGIVPGSARIENGKLIARVKFSQHSELARRVAGDLKDGIQFPLSAGYKVHRQIEDRTTTPPTRTIADWEPFEVSLVTVPAEQDGTGFRGEINRRSSAQQQETRAMQRPIRQAGESDADFLTRINAYMREHEPVANETAEQLTARSAEYLASVKRDEEAAAAATRQQSGGGGATPTPTPTQQPDGAQHATEVIALARQANLGMDWVERMLREKKPIEQVRQDAFNELVRRQNEIRGASGGEGGSGIDVQVTDDGLAGRSAAMVEALTIRSLATRRQPGISSDEQKAWVQMRGITDRVAQAMRIYDGQEKPSNPRAREYLGRSLVEIAYECLPDSDKRRYRGGLITPARADDIMARAFHSTSDFPNIFMNVLNKVMLARYQLAMPTYREIAVERAFNDFRPHSMIRAGDFPLPQPLTETGELRYGSTLDSREVVSVAPYGIIFAISRQMIVNDELGAIDEILAGTGESVLTFENTTFFAMFNSNPVLLTDSLPVFSYGTAVLPPANPVGHNNYADTASHGSGPPSISTIAAARQSLRGMRSMGGYYLNIPPRIILTGPMQETAADQMITAITPTLVGSVNPFSGRLRSVSDANITTSDWYIMAEPGRLPCFVYGFLAGATGPRIRTEEPFGLQGVRISLEHDFGCGAIDYRGVFRNSGSLT